MKKSLGAKTIIAPTPVWCVGTYDKDGKPNIATVAWGGICCSTPPCVTISLREATYSYHNIMEKGVYTVNLPSEKYLKESDYFGIASGKNVDKFKESGLTEVKSDLIDAPYIEEFPMVLECKVIHKYKIGLHTQFIGEILDVKVDSDKLDEKGKSDIKKIEPFVYSPQLRNYYKIGEVIGKGFTIKDIKIDKENI